MKDSRVQSLDTIRKRIKHLRGLGMPWRKIAALEEFGGSSAGMLANIYNGYEPKTAETRKRLGLAPKTIPIEPCPVHNIVHCWDCQTEQVQPLKPQRLAVKARNRRPYKNIDPTDPAQVQRQIEKYMPGYKLVKDE